MTSNWDLYDTRHVTFRPKQLSENELKQGYDWAYEEFYRWSSIVRSSLSHGTLKHQLKHFFWRRFKTRIRLVYSFSGQNSKLERDSGFGIRDSGFGPLWMTDFLWIDDLIHVIKYFAYVKLNHNTLLILPRTPVDPTRILKKFLNCKPNFLSKKPF